MAPQRCSGILYGVRLNRSRTAWSIRRLTSKVMTAPSSRVSIGGRCRATPFRGLPRRSSVRFLVRSALTYFFRWTETPLLIRSLTGIARSLSRWPASSSTCSGKYSSRRRYSQSLTTPGKIPGAALRPSSRWGPWSVNRSGLQNRQEVLREPDMCWHIVVGVLLAVTIPGVVRERAVTVEPQVHMHVGRFPQKIHLAIVRQAHIGACELCWRTTP